MAGRFGGNPHVLVLRGAGEDRGGWHAVVDRFPGFTRTSVVDLPDCGSRPDGSSHDAEVVARLAGHVAERLAVLRVSRPHVVGHALGAAVALELAGRVPVAAVTAFCPLGFRRPWGAASTRVRSWLANAIGSRAAGWLPDLRRLAGTTVNLVWAGRDRVVSSADKTRASRLLPHAAHTVIPDRGHLVIWDDPDAVAAVIHSCHVDLIRARSRARSGA